jgi:hypothetical protein
MALLRDRVMIWAYDVIELGRGCSTSIVEEVSMKRNFLAILVVVFLFPVLAVSRPAAANAQPLTDLTCPFSLTVAIAPGLSLTSGAQTAAGEVKMGIAVSPTTPCSSLLGAPFNGATGTITGSGTQNCLLQSSLRTISLTWNNGETSTVTWHEVFLLFVPIITASVTAGALTGDILLPLLIPTGFTGSCLLAPVTSVTLTGIWEFAGL